MDRAELKRLNALHDQADAIAELATELSDRFPQDGEVEVIVIFPEQSEHKEAGEHIGEPVKIRASSVLYMLSGLRQSMIKELLAAGVSDAA